MTDCRNEVISNDYLDLISEDYRRFENILTDVCRQQITENLYIVYLDRKMHPPLSLSTYSYKVIPNCYGLIDKSALESSGILKVIDQPSLNLTGKGVIIGIIDTGIDYRNKLFINPDNTTKIESIWDQTIQTGRPPEGFIYGSEYSSFDINEALNSDNPLDIVPSTDEIGHGTYVAGLAAGNISVENDFQGAAYDATLAIVKLKPAKPYLREFFLINDEADCYQENDIIAGVKYLDELARNSNKPLVICLALGTSMGNHSGTSPLCKYLNQVGRYSSNAIVTGTGNEANTRHHYYGSIQSENEYDDIEIRVGKNNRGFITELWSESVNILTISIISPSGEEVPRIPARLGQNDLFGFIFENTKISVNYDLIESGSGKELILLRFMAPTEGIWTIRVYSSGIHGTFHMWLPIESFLFSDVYFLESDPDVTLTEPSTASGVITTGAYNHRTNSISIISGRGFTLSEVIKPDIVAPGVDIEGPTGRRFGTVTGSSAAVAITSGAVAQFMEWAVVKGNDPIIDSVKIKNYLILGADRKNNISYPNTEWGYGSLNLYGTFKSLIIR